MSDLEEEKIIRFKQNTLPEEFIETEWQKQLGLTKQKRRAKSRKIILGFVITILSVFSAIYWLNKTHKNTIKTAYAERTSFQLPDNSNLFLHSNSQVSYTDNWSTNKNREIWLKGEAFFEVQHLANDATFIVHTSKADIEVIGTSFNVMDRGEKLIITLNEGKVKVLHQTKIYSLLPNEMLMIEEGEVTQTKVEAADYSAWTKNKLILNQTSLQSLSVFITQNYGYQVFIEGNDLPNEALNGTIALDNLSTILETIKLTLNVRVIKDETKKTLTITK